MVIAFLSCNDKTFSHFQYSFESLHKMMNKKISILQWNCRSIYKNIAQLIQHLKDADYDILLLQALNTQFNKVPIIEGFYYPPISSQSSTENKLLTAVYIKLDLTFTQLELDEKINNDTTYICYSSNS